jgi:hypothetical protein
MSIDVEYAIKKDIRNNPVVREVDRLQRRDFRRTVLLAALLVATLLFSAWQHFEVVNSGYQIEQLRVARAREESIGQQLRIKYEAERAPQVLEKRGVQELHMAPPVAGDTVVLERVPATKADKGIVAAVR